MALAMVKQPQRRMAIIKPVDLHRICDDRPADCSICRISTDQEEGAGGDQAQQLVVLVRKSVDLFTEVPGCSPVRKSLGDSPFAADCHPNSLIESCQVDNFFCTQAMSDGCNLARVDMGLSQQQVDGDK